MSYRIIPPNHVVDVTMTVEEGLLLSANPLCRFLIESTMARAQALHPVTICHYLVEGTHIHFLMVVRDPSDITGFAERFKTEYAHYTNTMLGREKRTVWCESFFCAPILTISSVIKKIAYIYTNPAKDNLESSIANYPGLSSWQAYRTGRHRKRCARLHRPMIPYLPGKFYTKYKYRQQVKSLKRGVRSYHTLTLSPDAWMEVFGVVEPLEMCSVNHKVLKLIEAQEAEFERQREEQGRSVVGRAALAAAHLDLSYIPRRSGKQMWCICDNRKLRVSYIAWAKSLKKKAREVYERWKLGDYSEKFPPGVFPPGVPKVSNRAPLGVSYC